MVFLGLLCNYSRCHLCPSNPFPPLNVLTLNIHYSEIPEGWGFHCSSKRTKADTNSPPGASASGVPSLTQSNGQTSSQTARRQPKPLTYRNKSKDTTRLWADRWVQLGRQENGTCVQRRSQTHAIKKFLTNLSCQCPVASRCPSMSILQFPAQKEWGLSLPGQPPDPGQHQWQWARWCSRSQGKLYSRRSGQQLPVFSFSFAAYLILWG